jgi:hypothetical protein
MVPSSFPVHEPVRTGHAEEASDPGGGGGGPESEPLGPASSVAGGGFEVPGVSFDGGVAAVGSLGGGAVPSSPTPHAQSPIIAHITIVFLMAAPLPLGRKSKPRSAEGAHDAEEKSAARPDSAPSDGKDSAGAQKCEPSAIRAGSLGYTVGLPIRALLNFGSRLSLSRATRTLASRS